MIEHPFGQQCTSPADNSGDPAFKQRQMLFENACVNGEKINALLCLFFDGFEDYFSVYILDVPAFDDLVDGDSTERYRASRKKLLSDLVEIFAGAQVHNRIGAGI